MQRSARVSRPGLTGSSRQSLLLGRAGGIVLEAVPDTTTSTSLRWSDGDLKEDGFKIERSTDGVTFTQITTVGSGVFQYNDTGLTESTEYYYRVREYLGSDDGPYSNVAATWTVPATPTSLTATATSSSQINLAWTDVSTGNTGYVIERRSPAGSGTYVQVGTAGATATSYSDTLLTASTQYEYRVAASNPAGISAYSNAASATTNSATIPNAPTGVSASPSTDGTAVAVTITWTDASSDEDGFYVYRNTSNTTTGATLLNAPLAGIQTYTDNATNNPSAPPAIGTTYFYWVSAHNGAGESSKTAASQNATGGVTTLNVPAAPTSLTATATSTTQIDLAWTDNATNETGYTVERRSPAGSGSYSTVTTLSAGANSYSNTGLTESTQYEYRVYATNAAGNSANSNAASKFTIPATPTGLTATAVSSSQIDLAWTDVSTGNTGQRIERRSPSGSGSYSTLTTVSATATTYSDTGLTASTSYEYRIVATNADYDSSPSTAANATTQSGALSPSWTLDFSSGSFSGATLTRASSGTYVDSSGYIASASTDVARLTHNSSGSRLGLLVEAERTNDLQFSEDPSNAYWTKSGSAINNNSGAFWTAPDNAATAVLLRQNTSTGVHNITRAVSATTDAVCSVFLQKQTTSGVGRYATLILRRSSTDYYHATFDLDQGTVTQSALVGTLLSATDRGIEAYANGWYRCWVQGTQASATQNVTIALATTGTPTMTSTGESYTGANTTDGVYIWGLMREANNTPPTSYIKTPSSASVTRSADLAHVLDSAITSWGDPGALVIHFYPPGQAGTLLSTDDVANEQLGIQANTVTQARAFWSSGNTNAGTIGTGVQKAVHYWNGTNSRFCINGGTVESSTNNITTFGNIDYVTFGAEATSSTAGYSQYANCIIRYIAFYSGTLTDANLQTITT
jgi:hypothetical protein